MRRPRALLLLTAALLLVSCRTVPSGASHSQTAVAAPASAFDKPVAVFFGDSYFNGSAYASKLQSEGFLAGEALGYRAVVLGEGGTGFATARTGSAPAPDYTTQVEQGALAVQQGRVALIVVEGGLNDRNKPSEQIQAGATAVLSLAGERYPAAKLVLLGPVEPTGLPRPETQSVIADLRSVADKQRISFIDAGGWLSPQQAATLLGPDHVHPTVAGHQQLSQQLQAALRAVGVPAV